MEIKDYLHLYLGCDVLRPDRLTRLKMVGICGDIIQFDTEFGEMFGDAKKAKPILRPLSSMTDKEAEHFTWLCMCSEFHQDEETQTSKDEIQIELVLNDGGNFLDDDVELYIDLSVRCFAGGIAFKKDRSILLCDEDGKQLPIDDIASKIQWLLSKHFDLFGLIEAGLAIDATIIK